MSRKEAVFLRCAFAASTHSPAVTVASEPTAVAVIHYNLACYETL